MSFEIVKPHRLVQGDPLPRGMVALHASATLCAWASDLDLVQINKAAVVLVCSSTLRIALRKPDDGEAKLAVKVGIVRKGKRGKAKTDERPDTGRRSIGLTRALRELGVEPKLAAGRYEPTTKNNLFIFCPGDAKITTKDVKRLERKRTSLPPAPIGEIDGV